MGQTPIAPAGELPDLVGRASESALISDLIDRTLAGSGSAVVLTGHAGAGKSALLDWAAALAPERGARALRASGVEFEDAVSFAVLQQLLLPLMDELNALPCAYRTALSVALGFQEGPPQAAAHVTEAAIALIEHAAAAEAVLLVVDDLQWIDRRTHVVLSALVRVLPGQGLSLLGASRPGLSLPGAAAITVGPLDAAAASALSTRAYPEMADAVRGRLVDQAEGNPLALLEVPRLLSTGQRRGLEPLPTWLPLPHRLQRMYETRIEALPAAAQRLLLLVTLAPTVSLALLAPAFPDSPIRAAAQAIIDGDLALLDEERLLIRHPLVSAAAVARASPEQQTDAHRALGLALVGPDKDLERRARHLAQAENSPNAAIASLLEQAAALAHRRGDGIAAMAMLLRSAELSTDPAERARRLARAAYVGASVNVPQAARILEDLNLADPGTRQSLETAVAAAIVVVDGDGDVDMAHRLLTRAIERYANRADPTDETLLEAINVLWWVCWLGGRASLWADYQAALCRFDPAPPPLIELASRSYIDAARTTDESLQRIDQLVHGLAAETNPERIIKIADIAHVYDRIPACRPALDRVVASAETGGLARQGAWAHLMIGLDAFHRGQWAVTESAVRAAYRLIESSGQAVLVWAADQQIALLAAARGDTQRARELSDAMIRWAIPRRAHTVSMYGCQVETLAAIGQGDFEQAFQHASMISPAGEFAPYAWLALNVALDLVESAVRTRRLDAARAHVDAMSANRIGRLSPRLEMICLAAQALVAAPDAAPELYERALAVAEGPDWPLDHARVELLYGSVLRRNQAITGSRLPLRSALATFERLGAEPWAERARQELQATAEKRESAAEGSQSLKLTSQELEIAELAAAGLPNKKIAERLAISHRTVGNHLYQVYAKLGIASRGGLRDALRAYRKS